MIRHLAKYQSRLIGKQVGALLQRQFEGGVILSKTNGYRGFRVGGGKGHTVSKVRRFMHILQTGASAGGLLMCVMIYAIAATQKALHLPLIMQIIKLFMKTFISCLLI